MLGVSSADIKETMNKKKKAYVDKVHHLSIHPQTRRHKNGYTYKLWVTKVLDSEKFISSSSCPFP